MEADVRISFARHSATVADWCDVGQVTVDMLPDVALLDMFDFYVNQAREEGKEEEEDLFNIRAWHTLVHVCRKWRTIVLGSRLTTSPESSTFMHT